MADSEEVGYGKPPANARWKKGQSGNPGGRPRSSGRKLLEEAAGILSEPVTVTAADGKRVRFGGLETAYMAMCRNALKGDDAALFNAIRVMLELVPAGEQKQAEREAEGNEAKRKLAAMLGLSEEDCAEP